MKIWALEQKILNSATLSSEEVGIVEDALLSEEIREKVLACEALLRIGNPDQSNQAAQTISSIVKDVNSGQGDVTSDLIMTFFSLPLPVLNQPAFERILKYSTGHHDEGVRVNTMVVLPRLAKGVAGWAAELLER